MHVEALGPQLPKRRVHIDGVPQDDGVGDQAKSTELVLLPFAIALPQLAALAVKNDAGELVASFTAIELDEDAAAVRLVIDISQQVERLDDPTEFLQRPRQ